MLSGSSCDPANRVKCKQRRYRLDVLQPVRTNVSPVPQVPFGTLAVWPPGSLGARTDATAHSEENVYIPRSGCKSLDRPLCAPAQAAQRWGLTWLLGRASQNVLGGGSGMESRGPRALPPSLGSKSSGRVDDKAIAITCESGGTRFSLERTKGSVLLTRYV